MPTSIVQSCRHIILTQLWINVETMLYSLFGWWWTRNHQCFNVIYGKGWGQVVRRCHVSYVTGAYSWARPAILIAGKGRGGMFLFLLFLHFHSCSSFFPVPLIHLFYYLFSPLLWEMTQNAPTRVDMSLNPFIINQLNWKLLFCKSYVFLCLPLYVYYFGYTHCIQMFYAK